MQQEAVYTVPCPRPKNKECCSSSDESLKMVAGKDCHTWFLVLTPRSCPQLPLQKTCISYLVTSMHPFPVAACRYAFFDTDNVIELAHPEMAVSDIFKKYGEEYFRNCERQVGGLGALGVWWGGPSSLLAVAMLQGLELMACSEVAEGVGKLPLLYHCTTGVT